jgi:hypothetical protein
MHLHTVRTQISIEMIVIIIFTVQQVKIVISATIAWEMSEIELLCIQCRNRHLCSAIHSIYHALLKSIVWALRKPEFRRTKHDVRKVRKFKALIKIYIFLILRNYF